MRAFPLKILTPEGAQYTGPAEELNLRATTGDIGILAGHCDMLALLGAGPAAVMIGGQKRYAFCSGGVVQVKKGTVTLLTTSFAWTEKK